MKQYTPRPGSKGLQEKGSTRAWRAMRERIPGGKKCAVCGTTQNVHAHHVKSRRSGGQDVMSNLQWRCAKHDPNMGRPRGS